MPDQPRQFIRLTAPTKAASKTESPFDSAKVMHKYSLFVALTKQLVESVLERSLQPEFSHLHFITHQDQKLQQFFERLSNQVETKLQSRENNYQNLKETVAKQESQLQIFKSALFDGSPETVLGNKQLEVLKIRNQALQARCDETCSQLQKVVPVLKQYDWLLPEFNRLKQAYDQLIQKVRQGQAKNNALLRQRDQAISAINRLKNEVGYLKQQSSNNSISASQASSNQSALKKQLSEAQTRYKHQVMSLKLLLQSRQQKYKQEQLGLRKLAGELQGEVTKLKDSKSINFNPELDRLNQQLVRVSGQLQKNRIQKQKIVNSLGITNNQLARKKAELIQESRIRQQYQQQLNKLKKQAQQVFNLTRELQQIKLQLGQSQRRLNESQNSPKKPDTQQQNQVISSLKNKLKNATDQAFQLKHKWTDHERAIRAEMFSKAQAESVSYKNLINQLRLQNSKLVGHLESAKQQSQSNDINSKYRIENSELKQKLNDLTLKLAASQTMLSSQIGMKVEERHQLQKYKIQCTYLMKQNAQLIAKLNQKKATISNQIKILEQADKERLAFVQQKNQLKLKVSLATKQLENKENELKLKNIQISNLTSKSNQQKQSLESKAQKQIQQLKIAVKEWEQRWSHRQKQIGQSEKSLNQQIKQKQLINLQLQQRLSQHFDSIIRQKQQPIKEQTTNYQKRQGLQVRIKEQEPQPRAKDKTKNLTVQWRNADQISRQVKQKQAPKQMNKQINQIIDKLKSVDKQINQTSWSQTLLEDKLMENKNKRKSGLMLQFQKRLGREKSINLLNSGKDNASEERIRLKQDKGMRRQLSTSHLQNSMQLNIGRQLGRTVSSKAIIRKEEFDIGRERSSGSKLTVNLTKYTPSKLGEGALQDFWSEMKSIRKDIQRKKSNVYH